MSYLILYKEGNGEIFEKKSRFIADIFPVDTQEEAIQYIEGVRKKYYDARHHCFAYTIGEKNEVVRSSDDGEPSGTAGHPMLDVIMGAGIHNVLVVVTRYFGGTLLGTGGLVRAYSEAAKEGIKNSIILEKRLGKRVSILTDYERIGKMQNIISKLGLTELDTKYEENVEVILLVPQEDLAHFRDTVTEVSSGRVKIDVGEDIFYGVLDGGVVFL